MSVLGVLRGGGGAYSFVACLSRLTIPLTTHTFRDGAPFLHLIETPPGGVVLVIVVLGVGVGVAVAVVVEAGVGVDDGGDGSWW